MVRAFSSWFGILCRNKEGENATALSLSQPSTHFSSAAEINNSTSMPEHFPDFPPRKFHFRTPRHSIINGVPVK
tara:strand:- start:367 stop:588 length:222 start_codon:yes stop_codon:yes gene_type:complete